MTTYDIGLVNGDLPDIPRFISGIELVMQRVERRLKTWIGEWDLDPSFGALSMDWFATKPVPLDDIGQILRAQIGDVTGVIAVRNLDPAFDIATKTISIDCEVVTEAGEAEVTFVATTGTAGNWTPHVTWTASPIVMGAL